MGLPDALLSDVRNSPSLPGGTWEETDPLSQCSVEINKLLPPTASPKKWETELPVASTAKLLAPQDSGL